MLRTLTRNIWTPRFAELHSARNPLLGSPGSQQRVVVLVTHRDKHSSTQLKRRFLNHPARRRVEARMGIDHSPEPLPARQFPVVFDPTVLPNGWSAPPGPEVVLPEYPFQVQRTKNKPNDAIGFLPIYTYYRKDGTKVTTRIKKVAGDRKLFLQELRAVLGLPVPKNPRDDSIRIRIGGTFEVTGNHVRQVRDWLAGLGF